MSTGGAFIFLELFVVFFCLGIIPGAIAWMLLVKDSSWIEVLTFGSIFGLVLMAFGGALSFWTQNYTLRYFPAALVVILGFIKKDYFLMKICAFKATNPKVLIGALLGFAFISVQLLVTLRSQPTNWSGWWTFYVDLPFQVALTSEFLNRAPLTFPWFPGTQLNYTWMIHSALGVWGSNLNVPSDFLVLQVWPVLFAILLPLAIAVLASKFIANGFVSLIAPAATMLFIGPIGLQGTFSEYYPTSSVSPTQELGQLLLITTFLVLHQRRPTNELKGKVLQTYSLVLLLIFFIVTVGSKGVMPLLIVGVMGTYWAYHYFSRSLRLDHFLVTGISVLAVLVSLKFVINSTGGIGLSLFHVLKDTSDYFVVRSILAIFLLLVWLFSASAILMKFVPQSRHLVLMALVPSILGIGATFLLSQGGKSQTYFYISIVPLLVILVVSAIVTLTFRINRLLILAAFFVTYATYWLIEISPISESTRTRLFLLTFLPISITLFVVALGIKNLTTQGSKSRILTILLLTSLSSYFAQPFSVRTVSWSNQSSIEDPASIQIELVSDMRLLKEFSSVYDMVVTNRLCNFPRTTCESRDFFLSEYSERRVYFETHAYTYFNDLGPHEERVQIVDKFMQNPSPDNMLPLWDSGVRWIFVDKTRPFVSYSEVATLKHDSSVSQIWAIQEP